MEIDIGRILSDFILAVVVMYMSNRHIDGLKSQISQLQERIRELEKQQRELFDRYVNDLREVTALRNRGWNGSDEPTRPLRSNLTPSERQRLIDAQNQADHGDIGGAG